MPQSVAERVQEVGEGIDFDKTDYQIEFKTSLGDIRVELFPDVAPNHCRNIVALAKIGFYNGVTFHRVISGFMIQGGCPQGDGTGGPGYTIAAEFNERPHEPGVLSMARTSDPNSAGSQFFLCLEKVPSLDRQYTVFGKTADAESLAVVKKVGAVATDAGDRPHEEVTIESAHVIETPR